MGGFRLERIASITRCCSSRPISLMPNASVATPRPAAITSWEKYGGIAPSSPFTSACVNLGLAALPAELAPAVPGIVLPPAAPLLEPGAAAPPAPAPLAVAAAVVASPPNRSGSENAGHSRALPHPRVVV